MNNKETKELAESMGVSVSDLMCFSRLTANGIEDSDKLGLFLKSNDDVRGDIITFYATMAFKKMDVFSLNVKADKGAREMFNNKVVDDIQEKISIMSVI